MCQMLVQYTPSQGLGTSLLNFPVTGAVKEVSRKNFRRYSALYAFRARTCRWIQARQESVCSIAFVPCHNCVMMFVSVISMFELTPCPTLRCAGWFGDRLRKGSPRTIWDHYGKLEAQAKSLRTNCDGEVSQATPGSLELVHHRLLHRRSGSSALAD